MRASSRALIVSALLLAGHPALSAEPEDIQRDATVRIDAFVEGYRKTGDRSGTAGLTAVEQSLLPTVDVFVARGDYAAAALSLIKVGQIRRMQGDWNAAIAYYERAQAFARQARHPGHEAKALFDRARAELELRDTGAAATHAQGAVSMATALKDGSLLFDALDVLAQVQVKQANLKGALESLNRAFTLPGIKDDVLFYGYLDRADIYLARAEGCDQRPDFDVCLQAVDRCRDDYRRASAVAKRLGWAALETQVQEFLQAADQRAWLVGERQRAQATVEKANLFHPRSAGDVLVTERFATQGAAPPPAIVQMYEQVRRQQEQAGGFGESVQATMLYVEGLQRQSAGDHAGALAAFLKAAGTLERDRLSLRDDVSRGAFLEDKAQIYVEAVLELLDQRRYAEAFDLMERSRARAMTDMLARRRLNLTGRAEQEIYARSVQLRTEISARQTQLGRLMEEGAPAEKIASAGSAVAKLEETERALDLRMAREAPRLYHLKAAPLLTLQGLQAMMKRDHFDLLEYLVTDTALILWHISAGAVHVKNVFVPRSELARAVAALRAALVNPTIAFDHQPARELFLQLLQPVRAWITGKRLVIVPHDVLNGLPMQVLEDPADGVVAGERWQLSYAPSSTIYADLQRWSAGPGKRVLAVADPGIPASDDEMAALETTYPGRVRRLGGDGLPTEANVKSAVGGSDVLHMSVHGEFNGEEPLLSYLALASGNGDDGHLTAAEMFGLPLAKTRLVVLSACETARVEVGRSNEVLGIVRALLYAGAGALVLSYWRVDADSTALWMETFHRAAQTTSLGEAAQRALMAVKATPQFAHPYYWGAFSLVARQ